MILVDWSKDTWDSTGFTSIKVDFGDICSVSYPGLTLMSNSLNYGEASLTCKKFNSRMGLCRTKTAEMVMSQMILTSRNKSDCFFDDRYKYWCGFDDIEQEDCWKDDLDNDLTYYRSDNPWGPKEPNGRTYENCVENRITIEDDTIQEITNWNDAVCDKHNRCFFCHLEERPIFVLRGLPRCMSKLFDSTYKCQ